MTIITEVGMKCERSSKKLRTSSSKELTVIFVLVADKEDPSDIHSCAVME